MVGAGESVVFGDHEGVAGADGREGLVTVPFEPPSSDSFADHLSETHG